MLVRPEEGSSLRSQLVRLMTSPVSEVKVLAAHLLFVLCKEDGMGRRDWRSVGQGRRWPMCSRCVLSVVVFTDPGWLDVAMKTVG